MEKKMSDKTEKLLEDIRNLLVLHLSKAKVNSEEIGKIIGIDSSSVRHILAGTKHKRKKNDK
jgi:Mn-dependent DtxR family transcriptional regulator